MKKIIILVIAFMGCGKVDKEMYSIQISVYEKNEIVYSFRIIDLDIESATKNMQIYNMPRIIKTRAIIIKQF